MGAEDWEKMKNRFRNMRNSRVAFKDHKFFRPWFNEAWRDYQGQKQVGRLGGAMPPMATNIINMKCDPCPCKDKKCKNTFEFTINIGYALLIAVDGVSRDQFTKHCLQRNEGNDLMDISHLHGISNDMNPFNLVLEPQAINLDRRECHHWDNISMYPTRDFCQVAEHGALPCSLFGRKMTYDWATIVDLMVKCSKDGEPAIEAYEKVPRFQW